VTTIETTDEGMGIMRRDMLTVDMGTGDLRKRLDDLAAAKPGLSEHALARVAMAAGMALLADKPEEFRTYAKGFRFVKIVSDE
jgi:hypothetical protein